MRRTATLLLTIPVIFLNGETNSLANGPQTGLVEPATREIVTPPSSGHSVVATSTDRLPAPGIQSQTETPSVNPTSDSPRSENPAQQDTRGSAILHLTVPSGSYVTINGNRTQNRNWNQHRQYLLTGVPEKKARPVEVVVKIRKDRPCKLNCGTGCIDCSTDYHTCCKTVWIVAGDEEYLTFNFESDSDSAGTTANLNYKILSEVEFSGAVGNVTVTQETSVHVPTPKPAAAAKIGHVL